MDAFEIDGLTRDELLEPVSLALAAGECVAVSGPSGCGKTVLLRAIADLDPAGGDIRLDGVSREDFTGPAWRRLVAYVPAEPGWWRDIVRDHFEQWNPDAASAVGLPGTIGDRMVAELSTGERQRLALLRALERGPRVLLLDEPTGPLDAETTTLVESLIAERRTTGIAVIWVSHDPAQRARVAGRVLRIDAGRLTESTP